MISVVQHACKYLPEARLVGTDSARSHQRSEVPKILLLEISEGCWRPIRRTVSYNNELRKPLGRDTQIVSGRSSVGRMGRSHLTPRSSKELLELVTSSGDQCPGHAVFEGRNE